MLTEGSVLLIKSGLDVDKATECIFHPPVISQINKGIVKASASPAEKQLSEVNRVELQRYIQQLQLKAYSPSTIRTYRNEFLQLLQLLKSKPVNELSR